MQDTSLQLRNPRLCVLPCVHIITVRSCHVDTNALILPEKHSRKSCSSLRARSIPFLACSSVRRVLISLYTSCTKSSIIAHIFIIYSVLNVKRTFTVHTGHSPVTWAGQRWRWDEAEQLVVCAQHWLIHPGYSASPATCTPMRGRGGGGGD